MNTENIDSRISRLLEEKKRQLQQEREVSEREEIKSQFEALIGPTTQMGKRLNTFEKFCGPGSDKCGDFQSVTGIGYNNAAQLLFCGYLEGDYSERSYLRTPIALSGGFFLRTPIANILFDPGNGTISGLRELGVRINPETDIIIVSHYHPSARLDLHTICNELGGFCPGRSQMTENQHKKVHLFSTQAVLEGRNGHPSILIPSDKKVLAERIVARPGKAWLITKDNAECRVHECSNTECSPDENQLLLRTFPAHHSETAEEGEDWDANGLSGREVVCYFIQSKHYGILFTGDTEYRESWAKELLSHLKGGVTVLIANMKTIQYEPKNDKGAPEDRTDWDHLKLTFNQLGFEGTKRLARLLKPKILVMRALGLECVVGEDSATQALKYAPYKLGIYRKAMKELIKKQHPSIEHVVIPGRHRLNLLPQGNGEVGVDSKVLVPAFPPTGVYRLGRSFVTSNRELAQGIDFYIDFLSKADKPYMVIQGESGGGKSLLANEIAKEMLKNDLAHEKFITYYDLATVEYDADKFREDMFGYPKGHFPRSIGHKGFLSLKSGVLILNQLEKLPLAASKMFLDVLEEWKYKQIFSSVLEDVQVKIIFTTNVDIDYLSNLTEDMKNRLRGCCLSIPRLSDLSMEARGRELSVFITEWCNRENTIIDKEGWEILFDVDLSRGAFRCLKALLHKARSLVEKEYGLSIKDQDQSQPVVFVSKRFVEIAMKENGVARLKKYVSVAEGPPGELVWLLSVWISHGCNAKSTYSVMSGKAGTGSSSPTFNRKLSEFRRFFNTTEQTWDFFTNPEMLEFIYDIKEYVAHLGIAKEDLHIENIFIFGEGGKEAWLEARSEGLAAALASHSIRNTREKFLKQFKKVQ